MVSYLPKFLCSSLIPHVVICTFDISVSSSRLGTFALAEIVLYQSIQFVVLGVSAGNILGQVGPATIVYFEKRPLFEL